MAVAVKNTSEATSQEPLNRLAVGSLSGTLYVLGSFAVVFYGLPSLWSTIFKVEPGPVSTSLLILVMVAAAAGLVFLGQRFVGSNPPHGLRAGVFVGVLGVLMIAFLTRSIGGILETSLGADNAALGLSLMGLVALALAVAGSVAYFRPGFNNWLITVEDQGWFSIAAYKRTQGQRVRRGTILGILILGGCGIYTLLWHRTLESIGDWEILIPFTDGQKIILLPHLQFTMPIVLAGGTLWLAYRIANFPPFADFLIATEAELNKVSWTTRKRLVQDTIVVLTTMLLITGFLFAADTVWIQVLTSSWIHVLLPPQSAANLKEIEAQIEQLKRDVETAREAQETEKATSLQSQIEEKQKKRDSILREKQGGPQDW